MPPQSWPSPGAESLCPPIDWGPKRTLRWIIYFMIGMYYCELWKVWKKWNITHYVHTKNNKISKRKKDARSGMRNRTGVQLGVTLSVWCIPRTHLQLENPQQVLFGCFEDGAHFTGGNIRAPAVICVMIHCGWSLMHGHGLLQNRLERRKQSRLNAVNFMDIPVWLYED